jgi:hypothetical protein
MNPNYTPIRPLIRCVFVAAAIAATLVCGAFVDGLARAYSSEALQADSAQQQVASAEPAR